uniref:procollagen-proline 3-dioxygenase n=1 Tax=Strigamia maritima TaxID=126957 RepID=T1JC44_STRMM
MSNDQVHSFPRLQFPVQEEGSSWIPYNILANTSTGYNTIAHQESGGGVREQVGNIQQAASSAYTFLSWNPNSEVMQYNFKYYSNLENIEIDKVKNLETRTFQELYLMGNEAYNSKKYHEVMHYFETALEEYFVAEEECRLLCEGPFDRNSLQDFIVAIANHFAFSLKCKQNCAEKLSFMYGEQYKNYLPSHYHYLQFAYFKVGEIKQACRAVATYLLFHGDDNTMKRNRQFYLSLEGVTEEDFTPVEEAVVYFNRDKAEKELLNYIKEYYKFDPEEFEFTEEEKSESTIPSAVEALRNGQKSKNTMEKLEENKITLVMGEKELNGSRRFVADGFATAEECNHLLYLAQVAAVNGDGYNGKKSPHTQHERFEGLTMGRAAILAKLGLVDVDKAKLLLEVSEKGRDYVQKYFKLKDDLLFTYTHLVCRTALRDPNIERFDLSHPVHADNCLLQTDGSCLKEKPAFTYRDYSAVIYLNDDFQGGDFIFAKDKNSIQVAVVKPKCGRLVGFSAGFENLHGVQAITSGRRCALAMWYTLDHSYREKERELAQEIIQDILNESLNDQTETDVSNFENIKLK